MLIEYAGQKYEFTGLYRKPCPGDYFLRDTGVIVRAVYRFSGVRAIVTPVVDEVTIGGIVWEVGAHRNVQAGEWFSSSLTFDSSVLWVVCQVLPPANLTN